MGVLGFAKLGLQNAFFQPNIIGDLCVTGESELWLLVPV